MKTYSAKSDEIARSWYLIDAKGKILGRLACEIAKRLRGKHKPEYTPHVDTGDYIVVINAEQVAVTGRKAEQKAYFRHSGYPGGLKEERYEKLMKRNPTKILELAIKGMLPKNPLGRAMFRKLNVYASEQHPHQAQQPQPLEI